jgi:hypothetical protein
MTVLSEQYDFAISLPLLSNDPPPFEERLRGVGGFRQPPMAQNRWRDYPALPALDEALS